MVELLLYALYPVYANAGHLPHIKKIYSHLILQHDDAPRYTDILSSTLPYLWPIILAHDPI